MKKPNAGNFLGVRAVRPKLRGAAATAWLDHYEKDDRSLHANSRPRRFLASAFRSLTFALVVLVAWPAAPSAQAALIDRGGGMIYDTTLNVTWLADMNCAKTQYDESNGSSGFEGGRMGWAQAARWAFNLVYGGFDDWRLPALNPADETCNRAFDPGGGFPLQHLGFDCSGGELSHLFVTELGTKARESVLNQTGDTDEQKANLALFTNVQRSGYWSITEYEPDFDNAWFFLTIALEGGQRVNDKGTPFHAVALRPGDVAAFVQEPHSAALVLLAIGAAAVTRRRRSR